MADSEVETNPRKKIKIDHNPDENGDNLVAKETPENTNTQHTESSQVIPEDREDNTAAGSKDDTDEAEERNEKYLSEKDGSSGDTNNDKLKESKDKDVGSDDNVDMDTDKKEDVVEKDDDKSDAESDVSALSDMSSLSGEDIWKAAPAGPMAWVMHCMEDGVDPRSILKQIIPDENDLPDVDDYTLWKLVVNLVSEPPPRNKLPDVNTLDDVIQLLQKCEKIMVLTGAGVSVSCGIPDFRSRNGIYARLAVDFPDLPDPQAMFDIHYFKKDQRPFFKFAKEIYPGQFEPSRSHKFIQLIEEHGKLLRNYTQNIDTLEQVAGIKNVIQCHGSFATATCMSCKHKCSSDDIKEEIMEQVIPMCPICEPQTPLSVMKPDIVFFGESLPEEFHHQMAVDKDNCDLLIVIGSSLKVRPVALIPNSLPAHVPQILINKEHLRSLNFDVELLGDCDVVVGEICRRLGEEWTKIANKGSMTQISMDELTTPKSSPKPLEKKSDMSEMNTIGNKSKADQDDAVNNENLGATSPSSEVKDNTNKSEEPATESDVKCQCNKNIQEDTNEIEHEEKAKDGELCKSCGKDKAGIKNNGPSQSSDKSVNKTETKIADQEKTETAAVDEVLKPEEAKKVGTVTGQGSSAQMKTDSVSKADDAMPGCSSDVNQNQRSTNDWEKTRRRWRPYRENVSLRLEKNQFCFVPPFKYIFPEAEYFSRMQYESDIDEDSDHDRDTTMDSSRELNLTLTTTDSSAMDGEVIDLTSDDEEGIVSGKKGQKDSEDISRDSEVRTESNDDVKESEADTAKITID